MELTRLSDNATLQLSDDLLWVDEHQWTPATAKTDYTITGALVIQSAVRQRGRTITLSSAEDMAWLTRQKLDTLYAFASEPLSATSGRFRLTLEDARTFIVAFRHADGAIDAAPVLGFPARRPTDPYRVTIRLMEIE